MAAAEKTEDPTVRFGVITLYHPLVMYKRYQPFVDYLNRMTTYHFDLKISQDYQTIISLLDDGMVDVALLAGQTYLEAQKTAAVIPLLAALGKDNKPYYSGVFITRDDNSIINRIEDIKGKRFAFASVHSTSGYLAPLYHLYSREDIRLADLASYSNLNYHDSVAREVLRKNFDAGVVLASVADNYRQKGIKFIGQTAPLPGFLLVVRPGLDPELVESLRQTLLDLDSTDPQYQTVMNQWDVNIRYGFTKVSDSDYDPIREMISFLRKEGAIAGSGR